MVHYCCVPNCKRKWKRDTDELRFHAPPKNMKKREAWRVAIKSDKKITDSMKICSDHFLISDYLVTTTGSLRKLKEDSVPSQNLPARSHSPMKKSFGRAERLKRRKSLFEPFTFVVCGVDRGIDVPEEVCEKSVEKYDHIDEGRVSPIYEPFKSIGIQTDRQVESKQIQTDVLTRFGQFLSVNSINDKDLKYLTGLYPHQFEAVFSFVMSYRPLVPITPLEHKDQLLLTLVKYKHNFEFVMLAIFFKVDRKVASNIFTSWTDIMYAAFKTVDLWSLRCQGEGLYTGIMDCTEIFTERSSNPELYQQMYSNYKNNPTWKGLVVIDEVGNVIFCSELFGGSTSDRKIVELSGLLKILKKGDILLADRGFTVSDLLEEHGVALNIPPFKGKDRSQLREDEVMYTRYLAKRRIHIERVIGLGKIHQILASVMPENLWRDASKIFFNCMLCNFKNGIVPLH